MDFATVNRSGTHCSKWDGLERKFGKDDILPLWVADMDVAAPKAVQDAMLDRLRHPVYGYRLYSDSFYQSIVDWYSFEFDWDIEQEWIIPEHGVVVSINVAIKAFTKPGDAVLIQTPIYPPFVSSVEYNDRKVLDNKLLFKDAKTTIDFEDFEQKAKKAKLFLLCSPHNPSSRAWSRKELSQMVDICHHHGVIIVSDEIHSDLVFSASHIPIATLDKAREITLILHAASKTFNIAGLNTSYLVIPNPTLRNKYLNAHQKTGLDNGNVFGVVALEAAYSGGKEWLQELKEHILANKEYVEEFMKNRIPEIIVYQHDATFLLWLDCRGLGLDDEKMNSFFINDARLGLNSGISFGEAGSGFMRLNIGTGRDMLKNAMSRLELAVQKIRA
ncbi:MAG: putative C-S lyase [Sulfurovum sp.]|nr:putative C-S lyase [Sulfurovum sp.]